MSKIEQERGLKETIPQEKIQFAPSIIALTGIPFTGKTTLGKALADRTNFIFCDVDEARWSVFEKRVDQGYPVELASPFNRFAMNVAYQKNHEIARDLLKQGNPVVLAATYSRVDYHNMLRWLSETSKVPILVFLLQISDKVAEERLEERIRSNSSSNVLTMEQYLEIKIRYQTIEGVNLIRISTEKTVSQALQEIISYLSPFKKSRLISY